MSVPQFPVWEMRELFWVITVFFIFSYLYFLTVLLVSLYLYYLHNTEERYLKIIPTLPDICKIKLGHEYKERGKTYNVNFKDQTGLNRVGKGRTNHLGVRGG